MAPPIKPETAKALKATTDSITAMDKENKAIKYADITSKLEVAIKGSNTDMIKLYLPKIDEIIEQMDHVMAHAQSALGGINTLKKDEDFTNNHFETIEKLTKTVADTRVKLTKQLQDAKKLHDLANKSLDDMQGGHDEGVQALAVLKNDVGSLKKIMDNVAKSYENVAKEAREAYGDRDQKTLTAKREDLIDYGGHDAQVIPLRAKVTDFMKKYHDKDLTTEAQYLLDDLGEMDDTLKKVKQEVSDTIALGQVEKIDMAKAAKELDIDKADIGAFTKCLNGQTTKMEACLTPIGKKLKPPMNGKQMIEKLRKAGVPV
jgi:dihydroneopterin aldolase